MIEDAKTWIEWHQTLLAAMAPTGLLVRPIAVEDWRGLVVEADRLFEALEAALAVERRRINKWRSSKAQPCRFVTTFVASERVYNAAAALWLQTGFIPHAVAAHMEKIRELVGEDFEAEDRR